MSADDPGQKILETGSCRSPAGRLRSGQINTIRRPTGRRACHRHAAAGVRLAADLDADSTADTDPNFGTDPDAATIRHPNFGTDPDAATIHPLRTGTGGVFGNRPEDRSRH